MTDLRSRYLGTQVVLTEGEQKFFWCSYCRRREVMIYNFKVHRKEHNHSQHHKRIAKKGPNGPWKSASAKNDTKARRLDRRQKARLEKRKTKTIS